MIIINVLTSPVANSIVSIGRQGENNAREVWFDLSWLIDTYGEGTATVLHKRKSDDAPYLVTIMQEGKIARWKVNDLDTAYDGIGQCELRWTVGDTLAKTITYRTISRNLNKSFRYLLQK